MRGSKSIGLGLAVLLLTQMISACTVFRTPYEQAKIQENGGVVKKESSDAGSAPGSDTGGGGNKKQGQKKQQAKPAPKPKKPGVLAQAKEQLRQQGRVQGSPANTPAKQPLVPPAPDPARKPAPKGATPRLMLDKNLSAEVSRVEGVGTGTVLIDKKHNAYVAVSTATSSDGSDMTQKTNKQLNVKTVGEVPDDLQSNIAKKLRTADPAIGTVLITNDSRHVLTLQRYAQQTSGGQLSELNAEALTEHIEDIWK